MAEKLAFNNMSIIPFRYDPTEFIKEVKKEITKGQKSRKPDIKIRYFLYCTWAYRLKFTNVGPNDAEYGYPPSVLNFLRSLAPDNIVGDVFDDAFVVTMKDFCEAMQMPPV